STVWWFFPRGVSRLEVRLPEIDVDVLVGLRRRPPELSRVEADAVERLGLLAAPVSVAVGEDMGARLAVDHPALPARVPRQARMAGRMDVACPHGVAHREARRPRGRTLGLGSEPVEPRGRGGGAGPAPAGG